VLIGAEGPASRLHQIVEWLGDGDYVIVLDECHKAKNAVRPQNFLIQCAQPHVVQTAAVALVGVAAAVAQPCEKHVLGSACQHALDSNMPISYCTMLRYPRNPLLSHMLCNNLQMPKEKKNEFPIDLMGGEALDSKGKKSKGDGFNGFSKGSSKTARVSLADFVCLH
jgi:hypothetical protein